MTQAVALFSGGLDSTLAASLICRLDIDVLCLTFTTPFFGADRARQAAAQIGLPLEIQDITDRHLRMLKSPRYGFGKNMNPCIDCHTLMLTIAGETMQRIGADFIITGEVMGQRPMSQTKQSLHIVAKNSGYAEYILRPLSAKLLDPTRAEQEGKVNREALLSISGRGRKDQMRLAETYGIHSYPPPAGGCLLTDPMFSRRLRELIDRGEDRDVRDYELLKYGRHFRDVNQIKIIVGRNKEDNESLRQLARQSDWVCFMADRAGPFVMIPDGTDTVLATAVSLCARYSGVKDDEEASVICKKGDETRSLTTGPMDRGACERLML